MLKQRTNPEGCQFLGSLSPNEAAHAALLHYAAIRDAPMRVLVRRYSREAAGRDSSREQKIELASDVATASFACVASSQALAASARHNLAAARALIVHTRNILACHRGE